MLAIIVTLPVAALTLLSERSTATNIVTYSLVGLTSPEGIDSARGLEDLQTQVAQQGAKTLSVGGAKVTFTAQDVQTLTPRELRLKAFGGFANKFYDLGPYALAKETGATEDAAKKFQNEATSISVFTAKWHTNAKRILVWMVLADLFLLAIAVLFSYRFGRLATPGVILVTVGAPALPLLAWAHQHPQPMGTARANVAASTLDAAETFANYIAPLAVPSVARVYQVVFVAGSILLAAAFCSALTYHFLRRHRRIKNRQADRPGEDHHAGI